MDREKIIKVINTAENATNKDLFSALDDLVLEHTKTKELIIELTHHLDTVVEMYEKIKIELSKRTKI